MSKAELQPEAFPGPGAKFQMSPARAGVPLAGPVAPSAARPSEATCAPSRPSSSQAPVPASLLPAPPSRHHPLRNSSNNPGDSRPWQKSGLFPRNPFLRISLNLWAWAGSKTALFCSGLFLLLFS